MIGRPGIYPLPSRQLLEATGFQINPHDHFPAPRASEAGRRVLGLPGKAAGDVERALEGRTFSIEAFLELSTFRLDSRCEKRAISDNLLTIF